MVDRDVITAKLGELTDRISRVRECCPSTPADLASSRDSCDLVAFNLMLAVQSCLDIASHIIADEGWRAATTLASAFARLEEHGVLSKVTSEALGKASGLRNVVAHGYARIDVDRVHRAATAGLADLEAFARAIAAWLAA